MSISLAFSCLLFTCGIVLVRGATPPVPVNSCSRQFFGGVVDGFNLWTFSTFTGYSCDVEGAVASGGAVSLTSYSIGAKYPGLTQTNLVVCGGLTWNAGSLQGSGRVHGTVNVNNIATPYDIVGATTGTSVLPSPGNTFVSSQSSTITSLASSLTSNTYNGGISTPCTFSVVNGNLTITGVSNTMCRIEFQATTLQNYWGVNIIGTSSAVVIIVVRGTSWSFSNVDYRIAGGILASSILWVASEATTVDMQHIGIYGSILAPSATFSSYSGVINGQVICNTYIPSTGTNNNIQINLVLFCNPYPLPTTATPTTAAPTTKAPTTQTPTTAAPTTKAPTTQTPTTATPTTTAPTTKAPTTATPTTTAPTTKAPTTATPTTSAPKGNGGLHGDPQFSGFHGQSFQFHGLPGEVFNLISSPILQVNGHFVYLSSGTCDYSETTCWTHPGTYIDQLGFSFGDYQLRLVAGSHSRGMYMEINGQIVPQGNYQLEANETKVHIKFNQHGKIYIKTQDFGFHIYNSDMFFNVETSLLDRQLLHLGAPKHRITDTKLCKKDHDVDETKFEQAIVEQQHNHGAVEALIDAKYGGAQVPLHGLIGQTWRNVIVCGKHWVGAVSDYVASDLFADDYYFNFYHQE